MCAEREGRAPAAAAGEKDNEDALHARTHKEGHEHAGLRSFPPSQLKPIHISTPTPTPTNTTTYPLNEASIPLRPAVRRHDPVERTVMTPEALQAEADDHGYVLVLLA